MLDNKTIKKINDFVYTKPRTIQEIALLIKKNWRTANSYVDKIAQESGSIAIKTFREGTRGALKIVYWNNIDKIHSSSFQERLQQQIETGRTRDDFSPSEIYQYVDAKKKSAWLLTEETYSKKDNFENFKNSLLTTKSQILFFSGNLTFCQMSYKNKTILDTIEHLAEKGISMKILTRVELPGIETIKKVLAINKKIGRDVIEIRHCYHPLRVTIVDSDSMSMKEVRDPAFYSEGELEKPVTFIYNVYDEDWLEWMQRVFWNLFRGSLSAEKRIKDLDSIKERK